MEHANKHGQSKVLHRCTLPLTGAGVVNMIITDLAVFNVRPNGGGLELIELADGVNNGREGEGQDRGGLYRSRKLKAVS